VRGTLVADALAIAYGANSPPAAAILDRRGLHDQLRCQKKVGTAVASYVGTKLKDLVNGKDPPEAEARARKQLDKLPTYCLVDVLQDPSTMHVPSGRRAVRGGRAGDRGSAGRRDGAPRLSSSRLLGSWVDRYGPNPQPLRPNILFI
jgi:hypothetical protein